MRPDGTEGADQRTDCIPHGVKFSQIKFNLIEFFLTHDKGCASIELSLFNSLSKFVEILLMLIIVKPGMLHYEKNIRSFIIRH
jgi:hypothetical protein